MKIQDISYYPQYPVPFQCMGKTIGHFFGDIFNQRSLSKATLIECSGTMSIM